MAQNRLSVEIFLRIPGGVGYTPERWLVKGNAARMAVAQKIRPVPSINRARSRVDEAANNIARWSRLENREKSVCPAVVAGKHRQIVRSFRSESTVVRDRCPLKHSSILLFRVDWLTFSPAIIRKERRHDAKELSPHNRFHSCGTARRDRHHRVADQHSAPGAQRRQGAGQSREVLQ